ncbi:MAG: ribulose-phosphate 3-epimerase [Acetobacteraceae bacterium]|nr:ribulose-phosphate 3-epimerase [Acetobacteraceae bacterium]
MGMVKIAPSLLAADFACLEREVRRVEDGGADWLHLDVMDGRFVPNITFGPLVVKALRRLTRLPLDVHLMIEEPWLHLEAFARAGADILTVHAEACPHLHRVLQSIRGLGCRPGAALNPATPPEAVDYVLPDLDLVLVMSVNPGFGGQEFLPLSLAKIRAIRSRLRHLSGPAPLLEVDGGVTVERAGDLVEAGVDVLVAGTAVFAEPDAAAAIAALRRAGAAG